MEIYCLRVEIMRKSVFLILLLCVELALLKEFDVYKMVQFDANGEEYGSRQALFSLEAKGLTNHFGRKDCVVARVKDLRISDIFEIWRRAGCLVALLPENLKTLTYEQKDDLNLLEQVMLSMSVSIPVYFVPFNMEFDYIIQDISKNNFNQSLYQNLNSSIFDAICDTFLMNRYQFRVSGSRSTADSNSAIHILHGEFTPAQLSSPNKGHVKNEDSPVIILTANLKTFGIYNDYPLNADASVLLSLAELISKQASVFGMAPHYRLVFLLSESGHLLNFQGTKKWLEEISEFERIELVICLDTITTGVKLTDPDGLYMHVSKPPKDKSPINIFFSLLKSVAEQNFPNLIVEGIHKKINLTEPNFAWEHERFSVKRIPAFTISSLRSSRHPARLTIFQDDPERIIKETRDVLMVIAESLVRYIYNINGSENVFNSSMEIHKDTLKSYLQIKSAGCNSDLRDAFEKHLTKVTSLLHKPHISNPEFMFYNNEKAKLSLHRIKPPFFEVLLTIVISLYLSAFFGTFKYFETFCKLFLRYLNTREDQK